MSICSVTLLELGFSARSAAEHARQFESVTMRAMPVDYLTPAIEDRALAVQRALAERGQHRAPSVPDLIVAAEGCLLYTSERPKPGLRVGTRRSAGRGGLVWSVHTLFLSGIAGSVSRPPPLSSWALAIS